MDIAITVESSGDFAAELRSLRDWLRDDNEFAGTAEMATPRPGVGEMGAISDTLTVVGGPADVAALAAALTVWLRLRKSDVTVHLRRGDREVSIDATNINDAARIIELASREL